MATRSFVKTWGRKIRKRYTFKRGITVTKSLSLPFRVSLERCQRETSKTRRCCKAFGCLSTRNRGTCKSIVERNTNTGFLFRESGNPWNPAIVRPCEFHAGTHTRAYAAHAVEKIYDPFPASGKPPLQRAHGTSYRASDRIWISIRISIQWDGTECGSSFARKAVDFSGHDVCRSPCGRRRPFSSRYARHSEQVVVHSYVLSAVYTVLSRCGDSVARG